MGLSQLENKLKDNKTILSHAARPFAIKEKHFNEHYVKDANPNQDAVKKVLNDCLEKIITLLDNPDDEKALNQLIELVHDNKFELLKYKKNPTLQQLATFADLSLNQIKKMHSKIFNSPFHKSSMGVHLFFTEDIEYFIQTIQLKNTDISLSDHPAKYQKELESIIVAKTFENKSSKVPRDALNALNEFQLQLSKMDKASSLKEMATQIFIAHQAYFLDLIASKDYSIEKWTNLTQTLNQMSTVLTDPSRENLALLESSAIKSNYMRTACDRERTSYAAIHIIVSCVLLARTTIDFVLSGGTSFINDFIVAVAENLSIGTGVGQFLFYSQNQVNPTRYHTDMQNFVKAARTNHQYTSITSLQTYIDNKHFYENKYIDCLKLMNAFKKLEKLKITDECIMKQRAAVLSEGIQLAHKLLSNDHFPHHKIQALTDAIQKSTALIQNPNDFDLAKQIVGIANKGEYDEYHIDKPMLFKGLLLGLVAAVLYVSTISSILIMPNATILSPIMLSIAAIQIFMNVNKRQETLFTSKLKNLGMFGTVTAELQTVTPNATPDFSYKNMETVNAR